MPVQTRDGVDDVRRWSASPRFGTADSPGGASYAMWTDGRGPAAGGRGGPASDIVGGGRRRRVADRRRRLASRTRWATTHGVEVLTGDADHRGDAVRHRSSRCRSSPASSWSSPSSPCSWASFVIYNSFSIIVAQRTREMALLRAVGASRRQVRRAVLLEAAVVGLTGLGPRLPARPRAGDAARLVPPAARRRRWPSCRGSVLIALVHRAWSSPLVSAPAAGAGGRPGCRRWPPCARWRSTRAAGRGCGSSLGLVVLVLGVGLVVVGALGSSRPQVGHRRGAGFRRRRCCSAPGWPGPVSKVLGAPVARLRGVTGGWPGERRPQPQAHARPPPRPS